MSKKAIVDFVEKNSWFQLDGDLENFDDNELMFATRENGNVGSERFGKEDWIEAKRIINKLMIEFSDLVESAECDTCDEWVNIEITLKD